MILDPGGEIRESLRLVYTLIAIALVLMAGLMSGLTLGLMSLDVVDLEVLMRSGTPREQRYAKQILPVIRKPHWTLVTLLICNAGATEALPIILDKLVDPITAIVLSVTVVLVFGEIIPQALCSRYGLAIGAHSSWFVKALMWGVGIVGYPISLILDWLLGHEQTALFRRAQLKALVDLHSTKAGLGGYLTADEIGVIRGALDLATKTAANAMTPLDKVFMLPSDAVLCTELFNRILASGHSRIPVHHPERRKEIVGLVLVKELLRVEKDQGIKIADIKMRQLPFLKGDTPMYDLLKLFQYGRSHMAVLTGPVSSKPSTSASQAGTPTRHDGRENSVMAAMSPSFMSQSGRRMADEVEIQIEGPTRRMSLDEEEKMRSPGPPTEIGEPLGIITVEDVIEELIQQEIVDETDQFIDNDRLEKVNAALMMKNLPPRLRMLLANRGTQPLLPGSLALNNPGVGPLLMSQNGTLKPLLVPRAFDRVRVSRSSSPGRRPSRSIPRAFTANEIGHASGTLTEPLLEEEGSTNGVRSDEAHHGSPRSV